MNQVTVVAKAQNNRCSMHICQDEILAIVAAVPLLGVMKHRIMNWCSKCKKSFLKENSGKEKKDCCDHE